MGDELDGLQVLGAHDVPYPSKAFGSGWQQRRGGMEMRRAHSASPVSHSLFVGVDRLIATDLRQLLVEGTRASARHGQLVRRTGNVYELVAPPNMWASRQSAQDEGGEDGSVRDCLRE